MIPSSFLLLEALPLNANGKVDRSLLPAPVSVDAPMPTSSASGRGGVIGTEEIIVSVWKKLLGVEQIGPTDNFFDLGGDSILLVEAHAELQKTLKRKFSVTDLFQFPSLRALTMHFDGLGSQAANAGIAERIRKQRQAMARQRDSKERDLKQREKETNKMGQLR